MTLNAGFLSEPILVGGSNISTWMLLNHSWDVLLAF
jgi:hypothetical protein